MVRRNRGWRLVVGAVICASAPFQSMAAKAPEPGTLFVYPQVFASDDSRPIELTAGQLFVPESRERKTERVVSIPFYRLRSKAARSTAPIFLLAGGPGASWIDLFNSKKGREEVLFYQQLGDVVLLDQRGAGHSRPALSCPERIKLPLDEVVAPEAYVTALRTIGAACRAYWERAGRDLPAYNTLENAADIDALRKALGYKKITLIAGSYGSHLALALIRHYPDVIERAMLRGMEGPDHTYDVPSEILAALTRIASAAERYAPLQAYIPAGGLIEALKSVEEKLAQDPVTVAVQKNGEEVLVKLGKTDIQNIARLGPSRSREWPAMIIAMARGDFSIPAAAALEKRHVGISPPGFAAAMLYMMDCSSGVSKEREKRIRNDPATEILGDINLDYFSLCEVWGSPDLGEDFRKDVISDIPVLQFHGTWDTATSLENGREVARGFHNGIYVEVEGATHATFDDLYELWPPMKDTVRKFVRGEKVDMPDRIKLPTPEFKLPE